MQDAPEPQPFPAAPLTLHDIFIGPEGLRAGWGLLLFVIVWELLKSLLYPMVGSVVPPGPHSSHGMTARRLIVLEGTGVLCLFLSTWLMARIEGRRVSDYGLRDGRRTRNFAVGAICGGVLLSSLVLLLRTTGYLAFDGRQLCCLAAVEYAGAWLMAFLLVGLLEEFLFRGYAQFTIARGIAGVCHRLGPRRAATVGFWISSLLTSFYFGFGHGANPGESTIGLFSAGLIGLVFCLSIWRSGSLWWAIGFHAAWDWMTSFIYGVGDSGSTIRGHLLAMHAVGRPLLSGGLTGPEGSLFVLPIIALAGCAVLVTLPRRETDGVYKPYPTGDPAPRPSLH